MPPALTYALLALCVGAIALGWWVSDKTKPSWAAKLSRYGLVLQLAGLVSVYALLRPGEGDDGLAVMALAQEHKQPVFIDLYSNF